MGRNRTFDEADVIARCAAAFRSTGYEGTSIDDLVQATGLHRGSLYKAFGSKRGLFLEALRQTSASARSAHRSGGPSRAFDPPRDGGQQARVPRERRQQESTRDDSTRDERTDLLLVALMELAPRDPEIRTLAFAILDAPEHDLDSRALGERLLARALEDPSTSAPTTSTPTTSTKEPT